jgi:TRAP-type mannitol/chloroaromatic compound transport system substrate-binding protein
MFLMQRRQFLRTATLAAAGSALAAPALAQSAPEIKWRLTSSFPSNLSTIYGGAQTFADVVGAATDGRFTIEIHPAGELAGALEAFDAVKEGRVECAQTALYYYWGKEPALVFATGVPFGMNAREQNAFFRVGGGNDLVDELLQDHGLQALPAGNTGAQMGGWFRNEIHAPSDLKGLKFRISGIAAKILQRLGVVPQAVARSDIASAFEQGRLDAAAWVSPADDEKLGLVHAAPWYYYPGWFQGGMAIHLVFNVAKWNELPKAYQAVLRAAAGIANASMQATYDTLNPPAVRRLVEAGAKLRPFPPEVMEACWQAANDFYRETAAADAKFQRALDAYMSFRNDQYLWWQVAEYPYDNFIIRQRAKG